MFVSCFVCVLYFVCSVFFLLFCVLFLLFIQLSLSYLFLQVYRPLMAGGNPVAINKYIMYRIIRVAPQIKHYDK